MQDVVASKVLVHNLEEGFRYVCHDILAKWRVKPNDLSCLFVFSALFVAQVCRVATCSEGNVIRVRCFLELFFVARQIW